MNINSRSFRGMLEKRPLNVQSAFGSEPVALVSGRDLAAAARSNGSIVLAANIRNPLTIKGVLKAAKKMNAVVMLELAKSEATYCGCTFDNVPGFAAKFSAELGGGVVFGLHVDHYAIKSNDDLLKSIPHLRHLVEVGWTSVAIDASHNPDWENLCFTRDVAMHIPAYLGLEAEVGEIKGPGEITTIEEAMFFMGGLNSWGIFPDFLAISNGSKHGTYDSTLGEAEGIDLVRTKDISKAIAPYGAVIAQHGISGTSLDKVSSFVDFGINKGNVGTLWQNVLFGLEMDPSTGNALVRDGAYVKDPRRGIPMDLWEQIVAWGDGQGFSRKSGDYKKANKPFNDAIMALPEKVREAIVEDTAEWAGRFIKVFRGEGSAETLLEVVSRRLDHNAAPEQAVLASRSAFTRESAPGSGVKKKNEGKDFSD
ncbi:MAG: class II fructose-bisphosphate aldolase [Thermovirgaceae bacterium]|nr:class II fructose-bisphosphate aldolase [Thermovirgaceae bacterium]